MKNGLSLQGKKVKGYFNKKLAKIGIAVTILITIILTIGLIYFRETYQKGFKYYNLDTEIGIVQQDNFLENTITNYLKQLEGEGYIIVSNNLTIDLKEKEAIIKKEQNDENYIKEVILNNLEIQIKLIKLTIKNENSYYFKTKEEAVIFINKLNEFIKQEYTIEESYGKIEDITSQEILNLKIEKTKEVAENKKPSRKRIQNSVSRGGNYSKKYNAPMASYVYISSKYGWRDGGWHSGVDFAAPQGTELYSWKDGIVTFADWSGNYGYFIIIEHNDGTVSKYAHCSKIIVNEGDTVVKNQTIGLVGSTGRSTGPHLHLEIQVDGKNVNPLLYL